MCPAELAGMALMVGFTTNESTADWKRLQHTGVECLEAVTDYGNL
jgi:hypothetical protein